MVDEGPVGLGYHCSSVRYTTTILSRRPSFLQAIRRDAHVFCSGPWFVAEEKQQERESSWSFVLAVSRHHSAARGCILEALKWCTNLLAWLDLGGPLAMPSMGCLVHDFTGLPVTEASFGLRLHHSAAGDRSHDDLGLLSGLYLDMCAYHRDFITALPVTEGMVTSGASAADVRPSGGSPSVLTSSTTGSTTSFLPKLT